MFQEETRQESPAPSQYPFSPEPHYPDWRPSVRVVAPLDEHSTVIFIIFLLLRFGHAEDFVVYQVGSSSVSKKAVR